MVAAFATTAQQLFVAHDKMRSNEKLQNGGTKQQTILFVNVNFCHVIIQKQLKLSYLSMV